METRENVDKILRWDLRLKGKMPAEKVQEELNELCGHAMEAVMAWQSRETDSPSPALLREVAELMEDIHYHARMLRDEIATKGGSPLPSDPS